MQDDKSDTNGRKVGLHKASANGPQNPPLFICESDNIFTRRLLDEESGNDLLPVADVTVKEVSSATRTQTPRVRASKLEFKRLDHLYNKSIHDFYLAESSRNSNDKDDKWEEYVFIVRRRLWWVIDPLISGRADPKTPGSASCIAAGVWLQPQGVNTSQPPPLQQSITLNNPRFSRFEVTEFPSTPLSILPHNFISVESITSPRCGKVSYS